MALDPAQRPVTIPEELRQSVMSYYETYEDFYDVPWSELDEVHRRFMAGGPDLRRSMLVHSYVYAVLTIQTGIDEAERHFRRYYEGEPLWIVTTEEANVTAKADHVYATLDEYWFEGMTDLAMRMGEGDVETVVREMEESDPFKYIGSVKAPFVAAQLGFTSKMCIDSNVQSFLGMDFSEGTPSGEEVDRLCAEVQDLFPELMAQVEEPYHLQWTLFNYARVNDVSWEPDSGAMELNLYGETAIEPIEGLEPEKHDQYFNALLDDEARVIERADALFEEVGRAAPLDERRQAGFDVSQYR